MKAAAKGLFVGALLVAVGTAGADDTGEKVRHGAGEVGQTVEHGAKGVGRGASKLYHDAARGVHRVIAKNAHTKRTEEEHAREAARHHRHSVGESRRSKKELDRAGKAAGRVTE
jgi:hypothetical protein